MRFDNEQRQKRLGRLPCLRGRPEEELREAQKAMLTQRIASNATYLLAVHVPIYPSQIRQKAHDLEVSLRRWEIGKSQFCPLKYI